MRPKYVCPNGHAMAGSETRCSTCGAHPTVDCLNRRGLLDVIVDAIAGSVPDSMKPRPGNNWSYDTCRFRKDSRCMYPKELDAKGSEEAGYAVWLPVDRGYCPRVTWEAQEKCPVYEPGPHSGRPDARPDATVAWEDGGQRV